MITAMVQKSSSDWMDELHGGTIVLLDAGIKPSSNYTISLIKSLVSRGYQHGIIVSLNVDCPKILSACKGMQHKGATCIHEGKEQPEQHDNCIFIPTLDSLTDMGILLVEKIRSLPPEKSFCIIDSVSVLEKHNRPELVARFVQFISSKLKTNKIDGVMLIQARSNDALKPMITSLFDNVVESEG